VFTDLLLDGLGHLRRSRLNAGTAAQAPNEVVAPEFHTRPEDAA
jgi:hypothetical protein